MTKNDVELMLDQQTIDEMTPPCRLSTIRFGQRMECGRPVTHSLTFECGAVHLACKGHTVDAQRHAVQCAAHGPCEVVGVSKL